MARLSKEEKERKEIRRQIGVLDEITMEGTIESLIEYLVDIKSNNHGSQVRLVWEYAGYDSPGYIQMYACRPENDDEYRARTEKILEKRRKEDEKTRKAEMKLIKQLKNKYPECFKKKAK